MHAPNHSQLTFFIVLFLTAFSNSIAVAGDYADRKILGFSSDGNYFAFEQYGVQDGSGFPYSEIFIIDTAKDNWVSGSPIRVRLDDEAQSLQAARKAAASQAQPLLKRLNISQAGDHLASNPQPELSADPHRVSVNLSHRFTPPVEKPAEFILREKDFSTSECSKYSGEPAKGFELQVKAGPQNTVVLHDDESLPDSRGCPQGYAIADVLSYESGGTITYAVLIRVTTQGFEGPDTRFLAVTKRLPQGVEAQ